MNKSNKYVTICAGGDGLNTLIPLWTYIVTISGRTNGKKGVSDRTYIVRVYM